MIKSQVVGVFFCAGMVTGILLTFLLSPTNYLRSPLHLRVKQRDPTGADNPSSGVAPDPKEGDNVRIVHTPPLSHEEVDNIPAPDNPIVFADGHYHRDDNAVANKLYDEVRLLCWVMTSPENLWKRAIHVNATWGKRCNKILYMSDKEDKKFPAVGVDTPTGREHLTAKTMRSFDYIFKNHLDDADWFMKADDDTYVIVENMRYMLSAHNTSEPIFFGHHFKPIVKQGYFSGGAGYVLSKEALKRFGNRSPNVCAKDMGSEDAKIGQCMQNLGVSTGDSRDSQGRSRFHCFNPGAHLHGGYPAWYLKYDKYGAQKGMASISDYAVTFHYVSSKMMYDLEFYVYHLVPYGIISGLQDLNTRPNLASTNSTSNVDLHPVKDAS